VLAQSDKVTSIYTRAAYTLESKLTRSGYYSTVDRQHGFVTHGLARINEQIVASAAGAAHAWFSKWNVHRFLRPEAYGGLVYLRTLGIKPFPVHESLLASDVISEMQNKFGSTLLPQINTIGSPVHPSYPAGHAMIAGACVTVLKAMLDPEANTCFPGDIEVASADGLSLVTLITEDENTGPDCITVHGELNKLAHNVATGRDMSGVHWRADGVAGILQGEEYAIAYLQDELDRQPECDATYKLKTFEGEFVEISSRRPECNEKK
jgi:hypothetical protein